MLTLVVSHVIGLTRDQRYDLHTGKTVDVVGISIPVWFEKGSTSEPANEVFVNYKLTNYKEAFPIKTTKCGFEINMPQSNPEAEAEIRALPQEALEVVGVNTNFPNSKNLLDMKDGGSEFLQFRQYAKTNLLVDGEKTRKALNIVHCVEIKSLEDIVATLG